MKRRIFIVVAVLLAIAVVTPTTSAVNFWPKTLGVAEYNSVHIASILVAPNHQSISLAVFATGLPANANHFVGIFRNDVCGAVGTGLIAPIGPVPTDALGQLTVAATPALNAPIDTPQPVVQNIAVRIFDNAGVTVQCGRVYTNNPGGAGSHWW